MAKGRRKGANTIERLKQEALEGMEPTGSIRGPFEQASNMVKEMCKHSSPLSLSKQLGLSYPTVGNLSKGEGRRINEKSLHTIQGLYNDWKAGKVTLVNGRKGRKSKKTEYDTPTESMLKAPSEAKVNVPKESKASITRESTDNDPQGSASASTRTEKSSNVVMGIDRKALEKELQILEEKMQAIKTLLKFY